MNSIPAAALNDALACRPHVLSLHSPDGQCQCVFSSPQIAESARILNGWRDYLARGFTAIEWWHGFPSGSYTERNVP